MAIRDIEKYIEVNKSLYRHLDFESSGIDVIIKGHLLVEEVILKILDASVISKEPLKEASLSFHKSACIVRALHENKAEKWVWEAIFKLNQIRNKVAHNLDHPAVEGLIEEFKEFICQHGDGTIEVGREFEFQELPMAIMNVHGSLWKILDEI